MAKRTNHRLMAQRERLRLRADIVTITQQKEELTDKLRQKRALLKATKVPPK